MDHSPNDSTVEYYRCAVQTDRRSKGKPLEPLATQRDTAATAARSECMRQWRHDAPSVCRPCAGNGRAPAVIRAPSCVRPFSHRTAQRLQRASPPVRRRRSCTGGLLCPERSASSASSGPDGAQRSASSASSGPDGAPFGQPDGIGLAAGDVTMLPCALEPPNPSAANSANHANPSEAADLIGAPHSRPPVGPAPALAPPPPPPPPPPPLVGESRLVSGAALGVVAATRILSPQSLPAVGASWA
jgi:hypothetical protein